MVTSSTLKNIKIIIGANYGDEGKGRVTDFFTNEAIAYKENTIVVCSNGGAQRGHTVVNSKGFQHIFHHFGSGTLAGADTYIPEYFIVNPMIFIKEYSHLDFCAPTIFIHPNCLVSTPFDMMNNQIIEENRLINTGKKHGSCGVGIWETKLRNGATYKEMIDMSNEALFAYLKQIRDRYSTNRLYKKSVDMSDEWRKIYYNDETIHHYIRDFRAMSDPNFGIAKLATSDILRNYDTIIFENGQGMLLDENYAKDDIYCTPSNTTLETPFHIIHELQSPNISFDIEVCYVTRSYITRHCLGDFREEVPLSELDFICLNYETNIDNNNQGSFRYGLMSNEFLNAMFERMISDYNKTYKYYRPIIKGHIHHSIAITHLDEYPLNIAELTKIHSFDFPRVYGFYGRKSSDKIIRLISPDRRTSYIQINVNPVNDDSKINIDIS